MTTLARSRAAGDALLPAEPRHLLVVRSGLYALSLALYLVPLASPLGIAAALLAGQAGLSLATRARRRGLRLGVVLGATPFALGGALLLGEHLAAASWVAGLVGVRAALSLGEVLSFGLAACVVSFALRFLSLAARAFSLVEVLFVAGSVAALLADHRNRMLNRPRFFSDWAWTFGVSPTVVLVGVGIAATLAAILLFLRGQRLLKLLGSLLALFLLGLALYFLWDKRIEAVTPPDPLGLSGKEGGRDKGGGGGKEGKQGGQGKGEAKHEKGQKGEKGEKGQGSSDDPFKDDYSSSGAPSPVAIAILRDDYDPSTEILYFRQTALSLYNGHHLVSGIAQGWDADVITEYPRSGPLLARPTQSPENHITIPTTMYLLVDHPQPIALTHARSIRLVPNPNPQQFVAAYDVESLVLSVQPQRLLGRSSIPPSWTREQRAHFTALPADPRYAALSDIIARDVDPRFAEDDLAKAFTIKRYLEREGFYTRKSTHASEQDPAASFLFGSLRGYCVHFAHAAVYLLRSQGIAARVALGYAVQINKRSGGSSILIMSDRAHAWPEIHLDGIGWVTFDIYPERTDMPPPVPVDYDLEKLLGELARDDPTAGKTPDEKPLVIPWAALLVGLGLLAGAALALAYAVKVGRRLAPRLGRAQAYPRRAYRALLDRLSDLGGSRRPGETRERHAARLAGLAPGLEPLTRAHLAQALGGFAPDPAAFAALVTRVEGELRSNIPVHRRALGLLNPIGWIWTR